MGLGMFFAIGVTLLTVIARVSSNVPSSLYTCIDWECEEWISQGRTMLRYIGKTDKHLSFQKNQEIQIISKPVDKNLPDWVGKVGNKVGLVPRDMVQELKMSKSPTKFKLDLKEILELTSPDNNTDGQEEEDDVADDEEEEEEEEEQSSNEIDGIEIEDVDGEAENDHVEYKNEENVDKLPKTEDAPSEDLSVTTEPTPVLSTAEPLTTPIHGELTTVISAVNDVNESKISGEGGAEQKTEIEPSLSTTISTFFEDNHQQQSTDTIFQDDSQNATAEVHFNDSTLIAEDNFSSEGAPAKEASNLNQPYYMEEGIQNQNQQPFLSSAVADPDVSSVNLQPSTDTVLQGSATTIDEYLTETPKTMAVEQNQPPLSLSTEDQVTPRIPETVLLDTMTSILQNQVPSISSVSSSAEQEEQIKATKVEKSETLVSKTFSEEEETIFALPPVEEKTREPQSEGLPITSPDEKAETVERENVEENSNDEELVSPGKVETLQPHKLTEKVETVEEKVKISQNEPIADTRGSKFISPPPPPEKEANETPSTTLEPENGPQDEAHSSSENISDTQSPSLQEQQLIEGVDNPNDSMYQEEVVLDLDKVDHLEDNHEAAKKLKLPEFTPPPVKLEEGAISQKTESVLEPVSAPEQQPEVSVELEQKEESADQEIIESVPDSEEIVTLSVTSPEIVDPLLGAGGDDSTNTTTFPSDIDEKVTESENAVVPVEEPEVVLVPENTKPVATDDSSETKPQEPETYASTSDNIPPPEEVFEENESQIPANAEAGISEEADKMQQDKESNSEDVKNVPPLPINATEMPPSSVDEKNAANDQHSLDGAANITPPSSPVISPFDKEEDFSKTESKPQDEPKEEISVPQNLSNEEEAVTEMPTENLPAQAEEPAEVVVDEANEQQPQEQHSNEGAADHDHHHHHHPRHHHHHHKRFTKDFLNDSSSTSSIILVIKHLSSTLLSFLPEPLQDTILDVDDALVFTGIIALTLVSICVPYFFIEGYMSVRPLKKKVVELNKSLWKVSAAYETQQEEFEIFKRKAIAHDEFKKRAEQSENDVVILKTLEQKHREQIQSLRTQLKSQMKEAKDIRALIEKTLQDKKVVEQESGKYKQAADKAAEALAKAKEELASFQTHAKSTALQLGMSSKSAEVLTTKITLLEQETENLKSQLAGESERRKAQSEEMDQVNQSKVGLERELADLKKICLQYEETVDSLNNEICKLDSELSTIKETLGEDSPLLELAEIQAKADFCEKEASSLRTRLEGVCADNENLRSKLQETEAGLETAKSERDSLSKRLEVLETYFKEREEELLKTIETLQQKEMVRDKGKDELIAFIEEKDEIVKQLNATLDGLKEELDEANMKHRNEIRSLEAKAHENWLSLCQAERKKVDAQKNCELLRKRLTAMVKERREAEEEEDDDDSGGDGLSGQLSMMFPSVIPHELVPPPILDLEDYVDDPAPPPSYFGLGEFVPPPPLPDDDDDDDEHDVDRQSRPPPLGGTRQSPSFSDMSDDEVSNNNNNNILSPIVRRRRDEECTDGSSGSGSSSPPLRSGGWINLPQQHGHHDGSGSGGNLRRLPSSSSRTTASDPVQPGANL